MGFARTKLVIEEDVYKPYDVVKWEFPVNDTKRFYEHFKQMVLDSFAIDEVQLQEVTFNADKNGNIKGKWIATKEFDDISYGVTRISFGAKSSGDGGNVTIEVNPVVKTEYPQDTIWQKTLFYEIGRMLADRVFYEKERMKYVAEMQRLVKKFENVAKKYSLA